MDRRVAAPDPGAVLTFLNEERKQKTCRVGDHIGEHIWTIIFRFPISWPNCEFLGKLHRSAVSYCVKFVPLNTQNGRALMPFLSPQVRPCRFLTRNTFFVRTFLTRSFANSSSYPFTQDGIWLAFLASFQEHQIMKKPDTSIRLLTLAEAASILKISKRTLHRMIQNRQIPAFKVGGQWRILESRFQEWVQEEENTTPKAG